jgi:hypothetical protein
MFLIKKACVLSALWLLLAAVIAKPAQSEAAAFAHHPVLEQEVDEDVSSDAAQVKWCGELICKRRRDLI